MSVDRRWDDDQYRAFGELWDAINAFTAAMHAARVRTADDPVAYLENNWEQLGEAVTAFGEVLFVEGFGEERTS